MKIGKYNIPTYRLFPKVAEAIKKIYGEYIFDEATDADTVAKLCGHKSANSGSWLHKLADMRSYGLLEKRTIRATRLAEKFTSGTEEDKQKAINEAILKIPLWREFYEKFGKQLQESNFWVQLQKFTGVSNIEAQKHADSVRKAYLQDIRYYNPEIEESEMTQEPTAGEIDTKMAIPMGLEEFRFGEIKIWLPKEGTLDAWKKTKKMIDIYLGAEEEG